MKNSIFLMVIGPLLILGALSPLHCSNQSDQSTSTEEETKNTEREGNDSESSESNTDKQQTAESNLIDFSAETVMGSSIETSDLEGKVVMFNYWGTWCPPCTREIPHFQETYEEYGDDFIILGIAVPQRGRGGKEDVKSFMNENGVTYPVIMFEQAPNMALQRRYGRISGIPTSFLLDQNGNHVETFVGYTDKKTLINAIKPLFNTN